MWGTSGGHLGQSPANSGTYNKLNQFTQGSACAFLVEGPTLLNNEPDPKQTCTDKYTVGYKSFFSGVLISLHSDSPDGNYI